MAYVIKRKTPQPEERQPRYGLTFQEARARANSHLYGDQTKERTA